MGAPLSLPALATSVFAEFFRMGRATRVVLSLYGGGVDHLFAVYGYQGSESDADQITSVLSEAKVCCSAYHPGWGP